MKVKTLLIVYKEKDESFFKQLKDLIDAKDDAQGRIVGVEDGTVRTFKCSEKQWLEHKAKGRENKLADKILFIDDVKDVELSHPVYSKYGISYGPIDQQQFAIVVDEKYVWDDSTYKEFRSELDRLTEDESALGNSDAFLNQETAKKNARKNGAIAALGLLFPEALVIGGGMVAKNLSDARKNADMLRSQMMCFAITKVYQEEMDKFMKE